MLEKNVVKFTQDGMRQDNLATGESKMLTQSALSKQVKYAAKQHVFQKRMERKTGSASSAPLHGRFTRRGAPGAAKQRVFQNKSDKKTGSASSPLRRGRFTRRGARPGATKLKKGFGWMQRAVLADLEGDDNPAVNAAASTYKAVKTMRNLRSKLSARPRGHAAAKASRNTRRAAQQAQRASAVRRAGALQKSGVRAAANPAAHSGTHGATRSLSKLLLNAGVIKGFVVFVAVTMAAVLVLNAVSSVVIAVTGGATQTTAEITAYVRQLDEGFLAGVNSRRTELAKNGAMVRVEGAESVDTDPAALALLGTGDWTTAILTPELQQKIAACHRMLNTLQVSQQLPGDSDTIVVGGRTPDTAIITITVIVSTAERVLERMDYPDKQKESLRQILSMMRQINANSSGAFAWAVPGHFRISSGFGWRTDPLDGGSAFHSGIDIPAPEGTPIVAGANGIVAQAGVIGSYGSCVMLSHDGGITTVYGHNSRLLVKVGDTVTKGQTIALAGHTGRVTGDHCHYEFRKNGKAIDPNQFLKEGKK